MSSWPKSSESYIVPPFEVQHLARFVVRGVQEGEEALDGERALSHKLTDSGARILVTSNLAALLPMALKFFEKGLLDRLITTRSR